MSENIEQLFERLNALNTDRTIRNSQSTGRGDNGRGRGRANGNRNMNNARRQNNRPENRNSNNNSWRESNNSRLISTERSQKHAYTNNQRFQSARLPSSHSRSQPFSRGGGFRSNNREHTTPEPEPLDRSKTKLSYKKLEELDQVADSLVIAVELANTHNGLYFVLTQDTFLREKPDWVLLITKLLAKVCQCQFPENKVQVLTFVFESEFIENILDCLHKLASGSDRNQTRINAIGSFLCSTYTLIETLVSTFPNTAKDKLHEPVKKIFADIICMEQFDVAQIDDSIKTNLIKLERRVREMQLLSESMLSSAKKHLDEGEPPEDFRTMELYPYEQEVLINHHAFLRRNIVEGGYRDVEHYLDIQFRLLREDLLIPIREGFQELTDKLLTMDPHRKLKVNNLRYFDQCQILSITTAHNTISYDICFDVNRKLNHINWEYNQWFKYGSLVFLSFDNFASFLVGKVAGKDNKTCQRHRIISVELIGERDLNVEDFGRHALMVESTIFFQPYYHVMKALKQFREDTFPLARYIVEVKPDINPPLYLRNANSKHFQIGEFQFNVLDEFAWPAKETLFLDEYQYEAFKGAFTKEFVIMQGPPGTGKTYLGLKIVETLLKNKNFWNCTNCYDEELSPISVKSPILIVCYTNHALDQFLEGILKFTDNVIRVGSMTKNETIKAHELKNLRRDFDSKRYLRSAYLTLKNEMKDIVTQIKTMEENLRKIGEIGILKFSYISSFMSPAHKSQLASFKQESSTVLAQWLLVRNEFQLNENYGDYEDNSTNQEDTGTHADDTNNDEVEDDEGRREFKHDENLIAELSIDKIFVYMHCLTRRGLELDRKDIIDRCTQLEFDYDTQEYAWRRWHLECELKDICEVIQIIEHQFQSLDYNFQAKDVTTLSSDLSTLSLSDRWKLYSQWVTNLKASIMNSLQNLEKKYRGNSERLLEAKQLEDLHVLRHYEIVGLTTTAAAKNHLLLTALKPKIVVVEEAAEVLESHIVTALTNECEHLILIGDHQQLRPNPSVYKLAKKYNLEISLFERMIKNKLSFSKLAVQHRMRPEICDLITPAIYQNLQNHPSVNDFENVKGVTRNLFFVTHEIDELKDDMMQSYKNPHEADFVLELAQYLLLQGYSSDEITILTTYSGQLIYFKMQKKNRPMLMDIRVSTVDNFQGEECQIILLSLVRSNPDHKIGFLATSNRVCVALSRAKKGLYLIGNMKALEDSSEIWPQIKKQLEKNKSMGAQLELECAIHKNKTLVSHEKDFLSVAEGGCAIICNVLLRCSHKCQRLCHSYDLYHQEYNCQKTCVKVCSSGHPCQYECYKCSEACQPCCIMMTNLELECGHFKDLECHQVNSYRCTEQVETTIDLCEHTVFVTCYASRSGTAKCTKSCDLELSCGHVCRRVCHVNDDPNHNNFKCEEKCKLLKFGCTRGHYCKKMCFEDCGTCNEQVIKQLACGHEQKVLCHLEVMECLLACTKLLDCGHPCRKRCKDECGPCNTQVEKNIPECGHAVKVKCKTAPDIKLCRGPCQKILTCGHPCRNKCNEPCSSSLECTTLVSVPNIKPLCQHASIVVPCKDQGAEEKYLQKIALKHCNKLCDQVLLCGHTCKGTCGSCQQGRYHEVCKEKCERVNMCGHKCRQACNLICPPCDARCLVKCRHKKCKRSCNERCDKPCDQFCEWQCKHEQCHMSCFQMCKRRRCYQPCEETLSCGHFCIGFCSEPCPDKCRICHKKEVTREVFGFESEKSATFVLLEDCGHFFESKGLEIYLGVRKNPANPTQMDTEIVLKGCPTCKAPIVSTLRFMNKTRFIMNNISIIKSKQRGLLKEREPIAAQKLSLIKKLDALKASTLINAGSNHFQKIVEMISNQFQNTGKDRRGRQVTKQLFVPEDKLLVFKFIVECLECLETRFTQLFSDYFHEGGERPTMLRKFAHSLVDDLSKQLMDISSCKITHQLKFDFYCEILRFFSLINLISILKHYNEFRYFNDQSKDSQFALYEKYLEEIMFSTKMDAPVAEHVDQLLNDLLTTVRSNVPPSMMFKELELVTPHGIIQNAWREEKISWYVCYRNHVYSVSEIQLEENGGIPQCHICPPHNENRYKMGGRAY